MKSLWAKEGSLSPDMKDITSSLKDRSFFMIINCYFNLKCLHWPSPYLEC